MALTFAISRYMNNIFNLPASVPTEELFETLLSTENVLIERIISTGQTTPPGEWYNQDTDEWLSPSPVF
jgi:cupin 2 domain-containing protein